MRLAIVSENSLAANLVKENLANIGITTFGELFNRHDPELMEKHDKEGVLIKIGQDPIDFLTHQVFSADHTVAFVLNNDQARCTAWSKVWGFLRKSANVIRVDRNPLHSMIEQGITYIDINHFKKQADRHEAIHQDLSSYFDSKQMVIDPDRLEQQWEDLLDWVKLPHQPPPVSVKVFPRNFIENWSEFTASLEKTRYRRYLYNE